MEVIWGLIQFVFAIFFIFAILHTYKLTTENHDMLEELLEKANKNSTTGTSTMVEHDQTTDVVPTNEPVEHELSRYQNIDDSNLY
jgi:hypothetical protein